MSTRSTVRTTKLAMPLVALTLVALHSGCTQKDVELPTYPVQLRFGGALPASDQVGTYQVTFTEGLLVIGDWWIYGMNREAAGYAALLKHAGHAHGDAEFDTNVEGTFVVDLLAEPQVLATNDLTEAHYFDGSIRLRPCADIYDPVHAVDMSPVASTEDIWGHTLLLSGSATADASSTYDFEIVVDAEAMVTGLVYGGTVWEQGATAITTLLDLGALLEDVDFAALADADGHVLIDASTNTDTHDLIKARLQDPVQYPHLEAEALPQ